MKWLFALNETSLLAQRPYWEQMIFAAVASAAEHTSLDPHLVWDGGDDPLLDALRALGVTVLRHRVSFHDAIEAQGADDPGWAMIAGGAYLRTEIPALLPGDETVVYTDCDVLFLGEFEPEVQPEVFACAGEFDPSNLRDFNTGVMVMNLPVMRETLPDFVEFIRCNLATPGTFDQDAYRKFYGPKVTPLPETYNWKPYWGVNPEARLLHFHGPKPSWCRHLLNHDDDESPPVLSELFHQDVPAYVHYVDRWANTVRAAGVSL